MVCRVVQAGEWSPVVIPRAIDECEVLGTIEHERRNRDVGVVEKEAPKAMPWVGNHHHCLTCVIDLFHKKFSIHGWDANEGAVFMAGNIEYGGWRSFILKGNLMTGPSFLHGRGLQGLTSQKPNPKEESSSRKTKCKMRKRPIFS